VLLTSTVERSADKVLYRGTIRDVTEKKQLEQQLLQAQKMESIGTLAGGIAHDFNNLLAMILGTAELLKVKIRGDEKINIYVDKIIDASERGASISRQLLLFARPEQSELHPLTLSTAVDQAYDFLKHFMAKNISVKLKKGDHSSVIMGDQGHLHQAIVNLALNAKDAMPNGGEILIVMDTLPGKDMLGRFPDATELEYVTLSVTDNGEGMDEEVRKRIFEPFFSTKGKGKGTGLGLAIVHGIVKLHNAFIDVQSKKGTGTIFTLYFPSVRTNIPQLQEQKDTMIQNNNETILVVDDEEMLREILFESLEDEGYCVIPAADGTEAIAKFNEQKEKIDLVITDLGMPNMGGEELYDQLKKINPDVKVIVSSGFLDSSTKSDLLRKGIKDVLTKPYKFDSIFAIIRKVIEKE
jgi:nitrogen-specific signal transduction histidine kinase/CheY-like chemotaxis protein